MLEFNGLSVNPLLTTFVINPTAVHAGPTELLKPSTIESASRLMEISPSFSPLLTLPAAVASFNANQWAAMEVKLEHHGDGLSMTELSLEETSEMVISAMITPCPSATTTSLSLHSLSAMLSHKLPLNVINLAQPTLQSLIPKTRTRQCPAMASV
jgi:hypothetical protein